MVKKVSQLTYNNKQLYVYSLRIDILDDSTSASEYITSEFDYSLIARETSALNKYHLQCIVLHSHNFTDKELNTYRMFIKRTYSDTSHKQPVSFKRSSSPLGLLCYVQKDGDFDINMPDELYQELMGKAQKNKWKDKDQIILEAFRANHAKPCWAHATVHTLLEAVRTGVLKSMPRKQKFYLLGFQSGAISSAMYMRAFYGDLEASLPQFHGQEPHDHHIPDHAKQLFI